MLDIKFIRDNLDLIKTAIQNRGLEYDLDVLIDIDNVRRKLIIDTEAMRSRRNELNEKLKKGQRDDYLEESKKLKEDLTDLEAELTETEKEWEQEMMKVPNIPLADVPIGKDESANLVVKKWGDEPKFKFTPKDHLELGETLDIIDVQRASKVSGSRMGYLKKEGVILEFALIQYAFKRLTKEGFIPVLPPVLIKQTITDGLGYWSGGGRENYYSIIDYEADQSGQETKNPLYLVGTGEHSIVPMHSDEVFKESELPKKYVAFTPCFRREAGTYGKDNRGIFRVHQFDKIEMVAYVRPEEDETVRHYMLSIIESMMQDLELPYQIVKLSTGDISFPVAHTTDIETWIPSQNRYRETHSLSTTTDFQARRLNIKYQAGDQKQFVHILNCTAIAIQRTIIAILENNQQADGSIKIPKVLQEFTGFAEIKKYDQPNVGGNQPVST